MSIKSRIVMLISILIIFLTLNYVFDYFFRPSNVDLLREFSVALGVSIGISFGSLMFSRKNKRN